MEKIMKKLEVIEMQYDRLGDQLRAIKEVLIDIGEIKKNEEIKKDGDVNSK